MATRSSFAGAFRTLRVASTAEAPDEGLGPLKLLPGTWKSEGRGWNVLALPFGEPGSFGFPYRLLMNQYDETLKFTTVQTDLPNRGISREAGNLQIADQTIATIDYAQNVRQIKVADFPESGMAGSPGDPIHHEPGLWLWMSNERTRDLDIARLAAVPHGDAVLALGRSSVSDGPPIIASHDALPIGITDTIDAPYMAPYKHFHLNPFEGVFDPTRVHDPLRLANEGVAIKRTTTLQLDTDHPSGGIHNIPFIVKQANATTMRSTFWIQELEDTDKRGRPLLRLQYTQTVMLDFFPRNDGQEGLIRWPHVSINTLEKVLDEVE